MIYITGDTHGDFRRFNTECFQEQKEMTKDDYVIVCGDFGGVWDWQGETKHEKWWLNWLDEKPYTTLFVDGNHECFPRLYQYPEKEWHGGKVHSVRDSVLHLERGEYYTINDCTFFTFGGAQSHDIDFLLDPNDPNFEKRRKRLERDWGHYRVIGRTWWEEEMPSAREKAHGFETLEKHGNKVDFVLSHDCPASTLALYGMGNYKADEVNYSATSNRACSPPTGAR